MTKLDLTRTKRLFDHFQDQRIAVIGDLMLDRYMWGAVQRISPEAPVPVVEVLAETTKLGGAANVANNILSLGAEAIPVGVVGKDAHGVELCDLFEAAGVRADSIITDPDRPTTMKTRIIANDQHVVRADVESKMDLSANLVEELLRVFRRLLPNVDGVILQDYNKGVLTPLLIHNVIQICQEHNRYVAVDPKFKNFFAYRGVDLFKPNTRETEQALGWRIDSDEEMLDSARELFARLDCKATLLTRGERGMALFISAQEPPILVPTRAKKIHDVSGAGDTVISTLMVSKLAGATLVEAAVLANFAAGIVCGEVGVVPINREKLWEEIAADCEAT